MEYYFKGCTSWSWYYPHHYTPFLVDLCEALESLIIDRNDPNSVLREPPKFLIGEPLKPFEQLVAVLPIYSSNFLPLAFHSLFNSSSPLYQFYPTSVTVDASRKGPEWSSKVLLPFIDEKLLLEAVTPLYNQLSDEEKQRNTNSYFSLCYLSNWYIKDNSIRINETVKLSDLKICVLSGEISQLESFDEFVRIRYTLSNNTLRFGKLPKAVPPPDTLQEPQLCYTVPVIKKLMDKRKKELAKKERELLKLSDNIASSTITNTNPITSQPIKQTENTRTHYQHTNHPTLIYRPKINNPINTDQKPIDQQDTTNKITDNIPTDQQDTNNITDNKPIDQQDTTNKITDNIPYQQDTEKKTNRPTRYN
jgi:5'-3' exonuclease